MKYEYEFVSKPGSERKDEAEKLLNEYGSKGWRLVNWNSFKFFLFEREIKE